MIPRENVPTFWGAQARPRLGADTSQALGWEAWLPSIVLSFPGPGEGLSGHTGEAVCVQRYCDLCPWLPAGAVWLPSEIIFVKTGEQRLVVGVGRLVTSTTLNLEP